MVDRTAFEANIQCYVRDLQNGIDSPTVREGIEDAMQKLSIPQLMIARELIYDVYDKRSPHPLVEHPKVESLLDFQWNLLETKSN